MVSELYIAVDGFDREGFYSVVVCNILRIGPYQGKHGCLVILFSLGACEAASCHRKTQIVDDVKNLTNRLLAQTALNHN